MNTVSFCQGRYKSKKPKNLPMQNCLKPGIKCI